jgi:N-acetylglucosamine-6-sulfatase
MKPVLLLASLVLGVLVWSMATLSSPTAAQEVPSKPNVVFILADDMRKDDLKYMPKTRAILGEKGMRFSNAFVSNALCCPSRATIMRGQYAHNHGLWTNHDAGRRYKDLGNERDNVATRLDNAGYRTGLFGKYFNEYDGSAVPPGWDRWFGTFKTDYFDFYANDNGTIRHFDNGQTYYQPDVLRRQTRRFIDTSVDRGKPFFAYVSPKTPHTPAIPAPRDAHTFDGEKAPRLPSFDERNVSDKPPWIEKLPRLGDYRRAKIDHLHEGRVESLQALDDLVQGVVKKLRAEGALHNTYVVFTSDNGWHHGEHRIPDGKKQPYEESIRVPLLVRGPGAQADSTTRKLALNTDYFPTFMDLAGARTPEYVDGRSLRPVLAGSASIWRTAILLDQRSSKYPARLFDGIRTSEGKKYIEYKGGFRELYNVKSDPYELQNSHDASSPPAGLRARLVALKGCAGATCRAAEDGP